MLLYRQTSLHAKSVIFPIPDSCKFLHDRSDYKSGWQLDREFEESGFEREGRLSHLVTDIM